ncbi:MAG: hypothetical protein MJ179_02835 [Treponema sp.]|nr:hypothetical protein [Treponema sp.]
MKKFIAVVLGALLVFGAIFAADSNVKTNPERDESKWTDLSYENAPILKILDGKDGYVVIYQKNKIGVGQTVIPKKWANGTPDAPRKLKFRNTKNPQEAFITIVKKGSEFKRVILTIPMSKRNALWGVVDYSVPLEGTDKENLDDVVF